MVSWARWQWFIAEQRKRDRSALFGDTSILFRQRNQRARELVEAAHMHKQSQLCVTVPTVTLHEKEVQYLGLV